MSKWKTINGILSRRLRQGDFAAAWRSCEAVLFRDGVETSPEALHCLLAVAELAAQYNSPRRARRWITRHREETTARLGELPAALATTYTTMAYAIETLLLSRVCESEAPAIDWSQTRDHYWAFTLRLRLAVFRRSHPEVLEVLRERRSYRADLGLAYEYGNTLRLLALHFYWRGEMRKASGYLRAANRHYRAHPCVPAALKRVEVLQGFARIAFHEGKLPEAERLYRKALSLSQRYRHPIYPNFVREELAGVFSRCGDIARATRQVRIVLRDTKGASPRGFPLRATAFLTLAELRIAESRLGDASRLVDRALSLMRRCSPRAARLIRANVHLVRGQISAHQATGQSGYKRALREFGRAEESFLAADNLLGRYRVFIHRGHVHIQQRNIDGVLREVMNCLELWKQRGFVPAKGAALLLKSQLLLQEETSDTERLYEEVLRDHRSVHNPLILFRVVANLYLYTWHLPGGLDLSDTHLAEIHKLRELFDRPTFVRLYERYVMTGVLSRMGVGFRAPPDIV